VVILVRKNSHLEVLFGYVIDRSEKAKKWPNPVRNAKVEGSIPFRSTIILQLPGASMALHRNPSVSRIYLLIQRFTINQASTSSTGVYA
jgi:hypothetical protein